MPNGQRRDEASSEYMVKDSRHNQGTRFCPCPPLSAVSVGAFQGQLWRLYRSALAGGAARRGEASSEYMACLRAAVQQHQRPQKDQDHLRQPLPLPGPHEGRFVTDWGDVAGGGHEERVTGQGTFSDGSDCEALRPARPQTSPSRSLLPTRQTPVPQSSRFFPNFCGAQIKNTYPRLVQINEQSF